MSYEFNGSKIIEGQENPQNHSINSQWEQQARALEEEIEMTIYNYESLLQL